ncbi:MAG: hypothetical protein JNL39_08630 [Opitutaceae bacterium]|nr:hypothetical protein [Opitutaceae bacterium]
MLALALSLAFLLFLAAVGRAILALCGWRSGVLRAWLLAPALGLAVAVLAIMVLNQAGLPVRAFAWPLLLGLAAVSAAVFLWRRPALPLRALWPFFAVAVLSLLWTGWPMARFGFGWLSYVNDDYVNYCLAAERFKDFAFWRVPTTEELAGRDIAQYYWFMHVPGLMRFGSEIVLAWVSALTGVKSLGIFMPVIIGLGLIQLFATAALVLHRGRWRRRALFAMALLAASPLFMLGSLYQLIAQVGGLALMLAATAVLTSRMPARRWRVVPHIVALSLLGAALAVYYPEVSAFSVLTLLAVGAVDYLRTRQFPAVRGTLLVYSVVGVIVLLRYNLLAYVFTIMLQMGSGFRSVDLSLSLFPYFMIPTGLANLFGLMPLSLNFAQPWTTVSIVTGLAALVTALVVGARQVLGAVPFGALLLAQFVLALRLMTSGNDFGLYKLAMFMQPALAAALACVLLRLPWSRFLAPLGVLVAAACCAPTALHYTRASLGEKAGGITEAKFASVLGTQPPPIPPGTRLLADINNLVAAKVAAFHLRGTDLRFLSRDYYQQIAPIEYERLGDTALAMHPRFDDLERTRPMLEQRDLDGIRSHNLFYTSFRAPFLGHAKNDPHDGYLILDESLGLFNKLRIEPGAPAKSFFKFLPAAEARNHLVFVHTGRGNHYYLGDRNRIAIFQQEADPYTPRQDITGLGRFILMRAEQPDQEFYLRISASKTFMGRGHTSWSSNSRVLGEKELPLAFPGHGAVNRIVGPVRPVIRDGAAYLAIDFNETPVQFPYERSGLEALYNTVVPLDSRKLVAYGRDISALSAAQLAALPRPTKLTQFPDDLLFARGLEFAGIYEDGWLSPESEFTLGGGPGAWVRVRGFVPELPGNPLGRGTLTVTAAGKKFEVPAAVGSFDWLLPAGSADHLARLNLRFSSTAPLPNRDDRPVGAKLEWLEVFPSLPTHTFEFGKTTAARLASTGIDQDGWFARAATVQLPPFATEHDVILTLEFPSWSSAKEMALTAHWPGATPASRVTLKPEGLSTLRVRLPASAASRTLRIEAADDFQLVAPDTRRRSGRLVQMEVQPAAP